VKGVKMKIICPKCGSDQIIRIVYGLPSIAMAQSEERGKIKLGGCCITEDDNTHYCKNCEYEFQIKDKREG
jgi:hypothetical protein